MTKATHPRELRINYDDLERALARHLCRGVDEFLKTLNEAKLERQWNELTAELDEQFAIMAAAKKRGESLRPYLDRIERLEVQRSRNMRERFGE